MAEDLKSMLMRVQQSRGRKSFTYAYATGKRADGKGDGHLQLANGRKSFKKDDVAEEVDKIGLFLQGKCWSDPDGKSIYLQGKGLSHTVVVKMKLTAKTMTGRVFDLQLPDPDEERRAASLDEDDESSESESSETPLASGKSPTKSAASSTATGLPKTDGAPKGAGDAAKGAAAVPAAGNVKAIQTLLQKLGYDPGKIDGQSGPQTLAAIKKFQQANGLKPDGVAGPKTQAAMKQKLQAGAPPAGAKENGQPPAENGAPAQGNGAGLGAWQAARKEAVDDLMALIKKVFDTKHADAPAVVKEIHSIAKNLPEKPGANDIDKLEAYIRHEDLITAAEEVPDHFHKLNIREPLLAALEGLKQGV
jgi:hypothetical protein